MNEPLNTSSQAKTFIGKSYNQIPNLTNTPIRLTQQEITNPASILDDFFQSYHLNDIRQIMWQWLTEVLSNPRDSANDPHERNNHILFYEKIESLVEAAWVMRRGNNQEPKPVSKAQVKQIRTPDAKENKTAQPVRFSKPSRLIEKATTQPIEVITEVFDQATLSDLTDYLLPNWLRVALVNTQSPYSNGNGREMLYEFYEQLIPFVEGLNLLAEDEQPADPSPVVTGFFQQCPIDYIRRELADFLEAGIGHDGSFPNGFSPWQAWMTYNHVLCLVEAAYQLYLNHQIQSVTNVRCLQMQELEEVG
ncbi:hypothetical protein FAM09_03465 [Niastella caeni]|uniref:Uncharacterized protein n=1 Tax=Niastella caeni TaxID=2569763 RepID=A0A4S8I003_9BACT|nr:hypothetical protein [Niastella caeni]THU41185.1 hypothetical protein FAM09_03465 [Niastella caeni]